MQTADLSGFRCIETKQWWFRRSVLASYLHYNFVINIITYIEMLTVYLPTPWEFTSCFLTFVLATKFVLANEILAELSQGETWNILVHFGLFLFVPFIPRTWLWLVQWGWHQDSIRLTDWLAWVTCIDANVTQQKSRYFTESTLKVDNSYFKSLKLRMVWYASLLHTCIIVACYYIFC